MKKFFCDCGNQVFFDSHYCVHCGHQLGFDPGRMEMVSIYGVGDDMYESRSGVRFRLCANGLQHGVCNWLVAGDSDTSLCFACRFNRTVPNQSRPENNQRWRCLEEGKKRLFFTLMRLDVPLLNGWDYPDKGLLFDFIEDARSDEAFAETFVSTGYAGGIITINALEADDVARTRVRRDMGERYRTVLGHLRHESGHYFWAHLHPGKSLCEHFQRLFGDETRDYQAALASYYREGPPPNWMENYISPYASAHPAEDWAETWGHFLHIHDALETAASQGVIDRFPDSMPVMDRVAAWRELSIVLNELNRSVGSGDAYPFVISAAVAEKLVFVDRVISLLRTPR